MPTKNGIKPLHYTFNQEMPDLSNSSTHKLKTEKDDTLYNVNKNYTLILVDCWCKLKCIESTLNYILILNHIVKTK